MTFSDALPIQFWDFDDDTYNESDDVCGIDHFCYCQEVEEADTLLFQFQDDSGYDFYLAAVNADGEVSETPNQFTESGNTFSLSRTPQALAMTPGRWQFLILRSPLSVFTLGAPSTWTDVGTAFDSKTATEFVENGFSATRIAAKAIAFTPGATVRVAYTVLISGSFSGTIAILFSISNTAGGSSAGISTWDLDTFQAEFTTPGTYNIVQIITVLNPPSATPNFINISVSGFSISGGPDVTITIDPAATISLGNIEKKSDCISVYEADSDEDNQSNCTKLITYSNDSNVFDIDYESGSPSAEFSIRLPLRFFHESYPQEEEVHALSTDEWLTLWSRLERKKLLEVGFVPYFMHKKLQMILMHDNISIDGEQWVRRDPYQIEEGRMRYPLKKATVLLTDKNTIERNLI